MQISLVQWVYLIFVVYLIFLIRCLGIVINTSSIFCVQDVLGWPWTLSGAICCLCLLIVSLFLLFVSLVVFYYCYLYFLLLLLLFFLFLFLRLLFFAFCEHGHANFWFDMLFFLFAFSYFFLIFVTSFCFGFNWWKVGLDNRCCLFRADVDSTCSGKRRWRYVWGNLLFCYDIILWFHVVLIELIRLLIIL